MMQARNAKECMYREAQSRMQLPVLDAADQHMLEGQGSSSATSPILGCTMQEHVGAPVLSLVPVRAREATLEGSGSDLQQV